MNVHIPVNSFQRITTYLAFGNTLLNSQKLLFSIKIKCHRAKVMVTDSRNSRISPLRALMVHPASGLSLSVATFRPTLDSTFNIITTRLEQPVRLEPSAPSHISSSWWPPLHVEMLTLFYLLSLSLYQPAADRRQHVASDPLRCSKASLNLLWLSA